jgi:hypothetical protein
MKKITTTLALAMSLVFAGAESSRAAEHTPNSGFQLLAGLMTAVAYQSSHPVKAPAYWDRQEVKTIGQVVRKLERNGGKIVGIETRGRDYQIIGFNKKGKLVTGRVDGHTGNILNAQPYRGRGNFHMRAVPISRVMANLRREGITDVNSIFLNGNRYVVEAENRHGRDFFVQVNARTGQVQFMRRVASR